MVSTGGDSGVATVVGAASPWLVAKQSGEYLSEQTLVEIDIASPSELRALDEVGPDIGRRHRKFDNRLGTALGEAEQRSDIDQRNWTLRTASRTAKGRKQHAEIAFVAETLVGQSAAMAVIGKDHELTLALEKARRLDLVSNDRLKKVQLPALELDRIGRPIHVLPIEAPIHEQAGRRSRNVP